MFWLGAGLVVLVSVIAVLLLYARGIANAVDAPYWATVKSVFLEVLSGGFWR